MKKTFNQEEEEIEVPEQLEPVKATELADVIKEGAEVYFELSEAFMNDFIFYDKTLVQWAKELSLQIPRNKDFSLEKYRELLLDLTAKLQVASNYYSLASAMADAIAGGSSIKKSDVVQALVASYQRRGAKRPAASVIERMAESYVHTTSAKVAANIVRQFWKQRLETLSETRKILEYIGMSLSVELKWTSN